MAFTVGAMAMAWGVRYQVGYLDAQLSIALGFFPGGFFLEIAFGLWVNKAKASSARGATAQSPVRTSPDS